MGKSKNVTPTKETVKETIVRYLEANVDKSDTEIAKKLISDYPELATKYKNNFENLRKRLCSTRKDVGLPYHSDIKLVKKDDVKIEDKKSEIEILTENIKKFIETPKTLTDICNKFDKSPKQIQSILDSLIKSKYNVELKEDTYKLSNTIREGGFRRINVDDYENTTFKFGFVTDNHLNSKFERLDILHAIYDIFEKEGITDVYNAGNWVDGEARFNKYEIFNTGITPQIEYFLKNYPQRKGITTHYIAGDDHEGWWIQREKINIGEYTQMKAEQAGRFDLKYLGYVEADVEFKAPKGICRMKIMHPGGGSAYALSYAPQKIVESFTGGEKPQILLLGHYHKADYLPAYRNVHIVQGGTTQGQTIFMRKKKLMAHLGGWIIEFQISKDGAVNRFKCEWLSFLDESYYKSKGYYR